MATNVNITGVVKTVSTNLHVRNRPSMSGDIIGTVSNGTQLNITMIEGDWCYATNTGGWSHSDYIVFKESTNMIYLNKQEQEQLAMSEEERKKQAEIERQLNVVGENLSTSSLIDDRSIVDSLIVNNLNGIYGIPYQFMASVDPRLGNTNMGRKYAEKIISKMPLLCMTPGRVKFMSNFSKGEKEGIFAALESGIETDISNIINRNGRYFTFEFAYTDYFDYVNGLCRVGARFLGIEDVELNIGGTVAKASAFDWSKALNSELKATLTGQEFIGFYIDSAATDSVTETFSNNTTQSQLAETLKGWSDKAREMGFLLGAGAGIQQAMADEADLAATIDNIKSISNKYLNGSSLFTDIASNFATVAVGGKLLFPEIWADSEYSRSFSITIKLRTPDSDLMSWYLNIYVPLCHLIALAAGHQTEHVNGYYSPFLVRAFYKGLFNVDMGIITSMNIRKGKEAAWNIDGLPTEIDVDIDIKDLYNMLSIVPSTEAKNFVNNNILMDYIANTCGVNINQLDLWRSLEIYYILKVGSIKELPNRILRQFQDAIDNYGMELYNKVINKFLI